MPELPNWFEELLLKDGIADNPNGLHKTIWEKLQDESPYQDSDEEFYRNFAVLFISKVKSNGQLAEFKKQATQNQAFEKDISPSHPTVKECPPETRSATLPMRTPPQTSYKTDKVSPLTVWESKVANYLAQPRAEVVRAEIYAKCPICNKEFSVSLDEYNTHQINCTHCKSPLSI